MQLNFVETVDMTSGANLCQVGHEPNNDLVEYYLVGSKIYNKSCAPPLGQYSDITFQKETNRVPVNDFSNFGIKSFPHIGALGWFRCKYENITKVLVPINADRHRYTPPTISAEQTSTLVQITIVPPSDVAYECYRILFRRGYTTIEYITYDTYFECVKPYPDATYDLYVIAYKPNGEISDESNHIALVVTGSVDPRPDPPIPGNVQEKLDLKFDRVELEETDMLRFYADDVLLDEVQLTLGTARQVYEQGSADTTWTINHNLGTIPHVYVLNTANDLVNGLVQHPTVNQTVILFNVPISGKAYLL